MKIITEEENVTFYELERDKGEVLEAIEERGVASFDVACEDGSLQALVACLATQAGLTGRYFFSSIYDAEGAGIGFELRKVADFAGAVTLIHEETPGAVGDATEVPRSA
jgi:hypothetical protein